MFFRQIKTNFLWIKNSVMFPTHNLSKAHWNGSAYGMCYTHKRALPDLIYQPYLVSVLCISPVRTHTFRPAISFAVGVFNGRSLDWKLLSSLQSSAPRLGLWPSRLPPVRIPSWDRAEQSTQHKPRWHHSFIIQEGVRWVPVSNIYSALQRN